MGENFRKYPSWGQFLKEARLKEFRSAREFCTKAEVGISYPQYSRYESGEQLPNLDQALRLCKLLRIPTLVGLLEWARAQIADDEVRHEVDRYLDENRGLVAAAPTPEQATQRALNAVGKTPFLDYSNLNDVMIFNRGHLNLFLKDPVYRDLFTYMNSFSPDWISFDEIAVAVGRPLAEVEQLLEDLSDAGIVLLAGGRCRASKKVFYFPDDEDFFPLRNLNFAHNVHSILEKTEFQDIRSQRAFRGLISRELTDQQVKDLIVELEKFVQKVNTLDETPQPNQVYSLCLLLGERFNRAAIQGVVGEGIQTAAPGLRTERVRPKNEDKELKAREE